MDYKDRSFGNVEEKLAEADFFLQQLRNAPQFSMDGRYYFSSFVSAARSVTFAIQNSLKEVEGFDLWYATVQERLKQDSLSRYFVEVRNAVQKEGKNPFGRVSIEHLRESLRQQFNGNTNPPLVIPDPSTQGSTILVDAVAACTKYFTELVSVVWECYDKYRCIVDSRWYFTKENFQKRGLSLEDALEELGFPRDWVTAAPLKKDDAWRAIRLYQPGCAINRLFMKYLGRQISGPDDD